MHAVYIFDAYGTLFDVHAAVRKHADAVGPVADRLSALWRTKQLEYSWTRALAGRDEVSVEFALDGGVAQGDQLTLTTPNRAMTLDGVRLSRGEADAMALRALPLDRCSRALARSTFLRSSTLKLGPASTRW